MAKKSSIKVRLVPEAKPNSSFFYYAKKPTKGEKAKVKLKIKNITRVLESTSFSLKKNYHLIANNLFFFKIFIFIFYKTFNH